MADRTRGDSEVILSGIEERQGAAMRGLLCLMCGLGMAGFASASAGSPKMEALVGGAKSRKLEERVRAVHELLSLREAVSVKLADIVSQANSGKLDSETKAIALFLIGELGLLQCRQILVAERDWKREAKHYHEKLWLNLHDRHRKRRLIGFPARVALGRAGFGSSVSRLVQQRSVADLSEYPSLNTALKDLSSPEIPGDPSTRHDDRASMATCWCRILTVKRRRAEEAVLQWYEFVWRSMSRVLSPSAVHPNEIRSTGAYLLGEFRQLGPYMLMWNIDMDDESGTCDRYAETIKVDTTTPQKPCVVALLKAGRRLNVEDGLDRIAGKNPSQYSNRTLLMRTLLVIDPQRTREIYRTMVAVLEDPERSSGYARRAEELQRLRSVEHVLDLVPSQEAQVSKGSEAEEGPSDTTPGRLLLGLGLAATAAAGIVGVWLLLRRKPA